MSRKPVYPEFMYYCNKPRLRPKVHGLYFIEDKERGWLEDLRTLVSVRELFKNGTIARCFGPIPTPVNFRKLVQE